MSRARRPTDERVRRKVGQVHTIAGVNPGARELEDEAKRLAIKPDETNENAVVRTFNYVLRRQKLPHGSEWKDAENAVLYLLSEVRKHQEGDR